MSPLGQAQYHTLTLHDTDWVKLSLDSGMNYLLVTTGNIMTLTCLFADTDTNINIYTLGFAEMAGATQWTCTQTGVWYARITSALGGNTSGTYLFNVSAYDSLAVVNITSPLQFL